MSPYNTFSIYIWPWGTVQRYVIVVHTYVARKCTQRKTHTCHFTTVKWYTRYTRGKSMADGCLHKHTRTHTHTQTLFHACTTVCTHTHIHTLRHFWGRRGALSGSHNRNIRMWRVWLLIAANPLAPVRTPSALSLPYSFPSISTLPTPHSPFLSQS